MNAIMVANAARFAVLTEREQMELLQLRVGGIECQCLGTGWASENGGGDVCPFCKGMGHHPLLSVPEDIVPLANEVSTTSSKWTRN